MKEKAGVDMAAPDAVRLLESFLNDHAQEIGKRATRYAMEDQRKTIYPDDVRRAIRDLKMEEAEKELGGVMHA